MKDRLLYKNQNLNYPTGFLYTPGHPHFLLPPDFPITPHPVKVIVNPKNNKIDI